MGMYNPLQNASDLSDSWYLKKLLLKLEQEEGQFRAKDLAIKGKDIMEYFNLKPGKNYWRAFGGGPRPSTWRC